MRRVSLATMARGLSAAIMMSCGLAAPAMAQGDATITIGTVNSLTGPFAVIGRPLVAGANAYLKMVNDQGGVNGKQLRLVALDDQINPDIGVAQARKLIAQGVAIMLAPISSGVSGALLPVLAESKVPMIAYTGVEALEQDPNYFAVGLTTTQTLFVAANYIKSVAKGTPKIAFLTYESPASNTARDAVAKQVQKWGWQVVEMQTYRGGATDYTTQALKTVAAQPDYIIATMIDGQAPQLFSSLQRAGNKATIVNFHAGAAENVFAAIASPLFLAMRDVPDPHEPEPGLKVIRDAAQKYGLTGDMTSAVFTKGWISAELAVDALKSCGNACTSDKIKAHLQGLTSFDTGGVSAKLSFSATKHVGLGSARIYRWDPDKKVAAPISGYIDATAN
jgi:branched-chain amino acid transport system substrate-binding protein